DLGSHPLKVAKESVIHRNAEPGAFKPCRVALLTRESNVIDPRHVRRISEIPYNLVHLALERFNRREARDIERNDHLTRVCRTLVVFVEVDYVAAKRGAVQCASKETEYEYEPISLVGAYRKQKAFFSSSRVGQRSAQRIDHPAFGIGSPR